MVEEYKIIIILYKKNKYHHNINGDNMEKEKNDIKNESENQCSENINALDEICKGACMGMDAIHFILDKLDNEDLKEYLNKDYEKYEKIKNEIEEIYPEYNDGKPHETGPINKAMTWYNVEMKTLTDDSTSKIAELLLQGINMGIIEGRRILNKKQIDNKVSEIVSEYVSMQEMSMEVVKKYL